MLQAKYMIQAPCIIHVLIIAKFPMLSNLVTSINVLNEQMR